MNQYDSIPGSDSTKFPDVSVLSKHYRSYSARLTGVTQCREKATLIGVTQAQYCSEILFRRTDAASHGGWNQQLPLLGPRFVCIFTVLLALTATRRITDEFH